MGEMIPPDQLQREPPKRQRFNLHSICMVIMILMIAVWAYFIHRIYQVRGDEVFTSRIIGNIAGSFLRVLLIALLFAYVAFRITRRSFIVGNIIFAIVFIAFGFDHISRFYQTHINGSKLQNVIDTARNTRAEMLRQYEQYGETSGSLELAKTLTGEIDKVSKGSGDDATMARVMRRVVDQITQASTSLEESVDRVIAMKEIKDVTSPADLEEWARHYQDMHDETAKFMAFYESLPKVAEDALEKENVKPEHRPGFMSGFTSNIRFDDQKKYRQTVLDFCTSGIAYANFLKEHWGKWSYDSARDGVLFHDDAPDEVIDRYLSIAVDFSTKADIMVKTEESVMKSALR